MVCCQRDPGVRVLLSIKPTEKNGTWCLRNTEFHQKQFSCFRNLCSDTSCFCCSGSELAIRLQHGDTVVEVSSDAPDHTLSFLKEVMFRAFWDHRLSGHLYLLRKMWSLQRNWWIGDVIKGTVPSGSFSKGDPVSFLRMPHWTIQRPGLGRRWVLPAL